jgi:hypothetical protein
MISITCPTNGLVASGDLLITVLAGTDQAFVSTKLFVDGQEMLSSDSQTNYVDNSTNYVIDSYAINTCEWPNGAHTLFAVAECASDIPEGMDAPNAAYAHAVSPYVAVTFSNLITRYSWSEPFFDPDAGQTQRVSAVFAANVNWTLQIQDVSSNTVRSATGSGTSMHLDWDGNGNGGTILPAGAYTYLLSAQTNGQPLSSDSGQGPGGDNSPPPGLEAASSAMTDSSGEGSYPTSARGAVAAGLGSYFVTPPPMPPISLKVNGVWTVIPWEDVYGPQPLVEVPVPPRVQAKLLQSSALGDFTPEDQPGVAGFGGPSAQATRGPKRPPNKGVDRVAGRFGLAWQEYRPGGISEKAPFNGLPGYPTFPRVQLQNTSGQTMHNFAELRHIAAAKEFTDTMARGAWQPAFTKRDGQLQASDLRKAALGGANVFSTNGVSLGLLMLHGAYGTSSDYDQPSGANGAEQIYFAIDGRPNGGPDWVRMSEMDFGGPGTNGLKWMAISACNSLRQANWFSMQYEGGWEPFNGNLHLLLGTDSDVKGGLGEITMWAKFMLGLDNNAAKSVMDAWFASGRWLCNVGARYAVAGWDDCQQDMLSGTNSVTPQGAIFYHSDQVKF